MKKVQINLNPKKLAAVDEKLKKVFAYSPALMLLVVFFALLITIIGLVAAARSRRYSKLEDAWARWEPKYSQVLEKKSAINNLRQEKRNLEEAFFSQEAGIILLEGLFSALPKNIWLSKLDFQNELVEIEGYALEWEEGALTSLRNFINALQENEKFQDRFGEARIKDTGSLDFRGREVTQFFLECKK